MMRARRHGKSQGGALAAHADSRLGTGIAAAAYTLVAATQKASGFLLLIIFTRLLSPDEYGQIALLTTISGLLLMVMTLGLEPRIMYAYFRSGVGTSSYLRTARRVSIWGPILAALILSAVVLLIPALERTLWVPAIVGACLLAGGTTYAYAVLRATRRAKPYASFAIGLLAAQVLGRVVLVAVLNLGPLGWAISDLITGLLAVAVGPWLVRKTEMQRNPGRPVSARSVLRDGLPLIPHFVSQWGLSLSDRLILVLFVSTAAVGVYSAIYQIAAVIGLMLSEVNRAFMPRYASMEPNDPGIANLIRLHLKITFAIFGVLFLAGFAGMSLFFPDEYSRHDELFPALAIGTLLFGLYLIPMNGLTLIAGVTSKAPFISGSALVANLLVNLLLDPLIGVWGAVVATVVGYATLVVMATVFATRARAISLSAVWPEDKGAVAVYVTMVGSALAVTNSGAARLIAVALLTICIWSIIFLIVKNLRSGRNLPPE